MYANHTPAIAAVQLLSEQGQFWVSRIIGIEAAIMEDVPW